MSTQPKSIRLSDAVYAALEKAAIRERKSLSELGSELIRQGLERQKNSLEQLMEYGQNKAKESHPGLSEAAVVELIHDRRQARRR